MTRGLVSGPPCQGCGAPLSRTLVDLGMQPLSNSYVPLDRADAPEPVYPLHARVCDVCLLVQVDAVAAREAIFNDSYAYFSSFSESWLSHCEAYAEDMRVRFGLGADSFVAEIASNDGYMLQYFVARGVPVLGIDPSGNVAAAAQAKGVPTEVAFFGRDTAERLAQERRQADLLAAKNVLAHVPDINDFVAGIPLMLKPQGVFTVEFPHLLNLIRGVQFDTIYHEHFTYLSLLAVRTIFARHGLRLFDVQKQPTHGGSLRVFACRVNARHATGAAVEAVLDDERQAGLDRPEGYQGFAAECARVRREFLEFLAEAKAAGRSVIGYGAAAKGNTLLNYAGVTASDILFVADRNPSKQNKLLPGTHIPVRDTAAIEQAPADFMLILPWNIRDEVVTQNRAFAERGGRFVTAIPRLRIF